MLRLINSIIGPQGIRGRSPMIVALLYVYRRPRDVTDHRVKGENTEREEIAICQWMVLEIVKAGPVIKFQTN